MYEGQIIASGSPRQLRQQVEDDAGSPLLVGGDQPLAALHALRDAGCRGATLQGRRVRVLSPDAKRDEQRVRDILEKAGVEVSSIDQATVSMQDVFVQQVFARQQSESSESKS